MKNMILQLCENEKELCLDEKNPLTDFEKNWIMGEVNRVPNDLGIFEIGDIVEKFVREMMFV